MAKRYLDQKLKLGALRIVDAIATHKSLLKASVVLGLSQPALTKYVQDLEAVLGVRIFERHARGVYVTEEGAVLISSARRILAELRRLDAELDSIAQIGPGTITLGVLPVAAAGILPGVLARLQTEQPKLRVQLQQGRTEALLPLLAAGEIDMIVGRLYLPEVPDGLSREPLWDEPISILARADHPLFAMRRITVEALRRHELVLPTVTQLVGQEIEALLLSLGLGPADALRSSSYGFIREMLHNSDMISAMPRLLMAGDLLRGSLRVVALPIKAARRPAGLILSPSHPLSANGEAFVRALRVYVADLADRGLTQPITNSDMGRGKKDRTIQLNRA